MFAAKLSFLQIFLKIHAAVTLAAAITLVAAPQFIPNAVGIRIEPTAYLIVYLLAAAELSIAFLSWSGSKISDSKTLRVILKTLIVFHAASGILEIYALTGGVSEVIWLNIAVRALVIFLLARYGLYKIPD